MLITKNITSLTFILLTLLSLAACNGSNGSSPSPASVGSGNSTPGRASVGGVDTGGGNAVDNSARHPSQQQIVEAVSSSKKMITYYLNRLYVLQNLDGDHYDWDHFLTDHRADLDKVIPDLKVQIRTDRACENLDGDHMDGSVAKMPAGEICISAFTLQSKLVLADFKPQIQALVLHEISHLVGADEPTARRVQSAALQTFQAKSLSDLLQDFRISRQSFARILAQFEAVSKLNPHQQALCNLSINPAEELISLDRVTNHSGLQQLSFHSKAELSYQSGILKIVSLYACTQDKSLSAHDHANYLKRSQYASIGAIGDVEAYNFNSELGSIEFSGYMGRELDAQDIAEAQKPKLIDTPTDWQKAISLAVTKLKPFINEMANESLAQFAFEISGPEPVLPVATTGNPRLWPKLCTTWFFDTSLEPNGTIPWQNPVTKHDPALKAAKTWHYTPDSPPENFSEDLFMKDDGSVVSMVGHYEPDYRERDQVGSVTYRLYQDMTDGRSLPVTQSTTVSLSMIGESSVGGPIEPETFCNLPQNY